MVKLRRLWNRIALGFRVDHDQLAACVSMRKYMEIEISDAAGLPRYRHELVAIWTRLASLSAHIRECLPDPPEPRRLLTKAEAFPEWAEYKAQRHRAWLADRDRRRAVSDD